MPRPRPRDAEKQRTDLVATAVRAFQEATGVPARAMQPPPDRDGADILVRIGEEEPFLAVCKPTLTPTTLGPALAEIRKLPQHGVLVARHVTPPMAERLRNYDVPFLDTAGNAYVRTPRLLILVSGRKPPGKTPNEQPVRAFRATGLKVVFVLLCRPELVAAPYRKIAEAAGVALGAVTPVFRDLERLGFLRVTKARGRGLERQAELLDAWVEGYLRDLRPRLHPRRFRVARPRWWEDEDWAELAVWLGGEPAAALLTKRLIPQDAVLYDGDGFAELARRIRPARDERGNLEVLDKFWNFEVLPAGPHHPRLAPPLLVYADLVATGDARNLEAAEVIRERFLA